MTDFASLIISWWGLKIATIQADHKNTFGYRYCVLTALINIVSLITISLFIFYKAVDRFLHPVTVEPQGMTVMIPAQMVFNMN